MDAELFLKLLFAFSIITGLLTECIKQFIKDKENISYNIVALIVALVVGIAGTAIYYQLNAITFSVNNIIYMVLMGFTSGLMSMLGFDKVKQALVQCGLIKTS